MGQETIVGSDAISVLGLPGDLDAFPVYQITRDADGREKSRRIVRLEIRGAINELTAGWRAALEALDARDRAWLLTSKSGQAAGIARKFGDRGLNVFYRWCASGLVTFQVKTASPSGQGHGGLVSWRLANPAHDEACRLSDEKKALRGAQDTAARALAAALTPCPAFQKLVVILKDDKRRAYWDHVIDRGNSILAIGELSAASGELPALLVKRLARETEADYPHESEPFAESTQSRVFRAEHRLTAAPVALKVRRLHDEESRRRMGREIAAGERYGSHPHVMPVLDADPDGRWLVMPLASGDAHKYASSLQETEALLALVRSICEGLRLPHAEGWIHRDIKPANILLLEGRWVVGDWGLGRRRLGESSGPRITQIGTGFGTEGFAAPEMSADAHGDPTPATDIYSIGQLIGAILREQRPQANIPLLPDSGPWRPIAAEATRFNQVDRPQTVDDLLGLLRSIR
jgi:eukaryotic-like serine/threonine-protein kinase